MKNKYGYIVWFVATLFMVYSFSLNTAAGVFAEPIQKALSLTPSQATIAVSCFILGFALFQIPAGVLLDRYNNKIVLCTSILCLAFGSFLTSISGGIAFFALANIVMGIGASFAFISVGKAVSCWFKIALFPVMFGLSQTLACVLSGFIHAALSTALKVMTWNKVYLILAIVGFTVFALNLVFFRNKKVDTIKTNTQNDNNGSIKVLPALLKVASTKEVWICTIVASFAFGSLMAYAGVWYTGVTTHFHISVLHTSIIGILLFAGIGIGTPLWGLLSNKFNTKKGVMNITLLLGTVFMLLSIYLPHFHMHTQVLSYINNFMIGFLISSSMLTYAAAAEAVPQELTGIAISFVNMFVFIINTVFVSLPYSLFINGTDYRQAYWVFPVSVIISVLFLGFVKEKKMEVVSA